MQPADYQKLKTELTTDPAALGYSTMSNAQKAAALQNANIVQQNAVPMPAVAIWAASVGVSAKLVDRSNNAADPLRPLAISFLNCIQGGYPTLDVTNSGVDGMVRQFEAAGDFTDAQRQQLYSLGQTSIARWQQIGISEAPFEGDVAYALSI